MKSRLGWLALLFFCFAATAKDIWAADFWWQWKTGELISKSGIPHYDTLSYTSFGNPWIEMRWLFCLALNKIQLYLGYSAVVWLSIVLVFSAFAIACAFSRNTRLLPAAALLAAFAASDRFFIRPELVSYVFVAIYAVSLYRYRGGWHIFFLLPAQIIWTNTHTLFALGPAICLLWLLCSLRKNLLIPALLTVAVFLACLINPYGLSGALFPIQLFAEIHGTAFKNSILELRPPTAYLMSPPVWGLFALAAVVVFASVYRRFRVDAFLGVLTLAMMYLAFTAIRNVPLFCIVSIPFLANALPEINSSKVVNLAAAVAAFLIGVMHVSNTWYEWNNDSNRFGFGISKTRYPIESTEILHDLAASNVFCTMTEGSYLLAHGISPFMDPRLEVHGEKQFSRYMRMLTDKKEYDRAAAEYHFPAALVARDTKLSKALLTDPNWVLFYEDTNANLYVRSLATPQRDKTKPDVRPLHRPQ